METDRISILQWRVTPMPNANGGVSLSTANNWDGGSQIFLNPTPQNNTYMTVATTTMSAFNIYFQTWNGSTNNTFM